MKKEKKIQINFNNNLNKEVPLISLKNISKKYNDKEVIKDFSLNIYKGERIAILGHNGSGKTTLTEIISLIKKPTSGVIDYNHFSSRENFGIETGIQFQKLIYPEGYRVKEIINFFNKLVNPKKRYSKNELNDLIKLFEINKFYNKSLTSLSGGQQQRINLFLTYIKKPSFIIFDELSTGLDIDIYEKIVNLFDEYIKKNNVTVILVSHNIDEIKKLTSKAYFLKDGNIQKELLTSKLNFNNFFNLIKRNDFNIEERINFNFEKQKKKDNDILNYLIYLRKFKYLFFHDNEKIKSNVSKMRENSSLLSKNEIEVNEKNDEIEKKLIEKKQELIKLEKESKRNIDETKKEELKKILKNKNIEKKQLENKQKKVINKISKIENKMEKIDKEIDFIFSLILYKFNRKISRLTNIISKNEIKYNDLRIFDYLKDESKVKKINILEEKIPKLKNELEILRKSKNGTKSFFKNLLILENDQKDYLIIKNLKKYYGIIPIINGLNLKIKKGSRIAITGPNGSGKTTLTEIISTTLNKTTGKINYWFTRNKYKAKHNIGMQFQESSFPSDLTVKQIINLFYGASKNKIKESYLDELVNVFKLNHILNQNGSNLSGGERQRLNVLIALLKKPKLLILDEISSGLDVESIRDINFYIDKYIEKTKATLILISHNPEEVKRLTNKLLILSKGQIINTKDIKNTSLVELKKFFKEIYQ